MTDNEKTMDDLNDIISTLDMSYLNDKKYCNNCLGRLFAKLGKGIPNEERGEAVREALRITVRTTTEDCEMCVGICGKFDYYTDLSESKLSGYDFSSFLIGSKFDAEIIEKEEMLWSQASGEYSEPIKAEFNREVGKFLYEKIQVEVSFDKPDIVIVLDTTYDSVDFQIAPLFIYGRYRKLVRGIPQTRWPCRQCLGKGCGRCGDTGKMYQTSVEELIGQVVLEHSNGKDHRFHGMGREDVDALMIGTGRPFILEIKEPVKRNLPLENIKELINDAENGVEVSTLRYSDNQEVVKIKNARPDKKYKVSVYFDNDLTEEKLNEVVASLGGKTITQHTPKRVLHRRADKARNRSIKSIELKGLVGKLATIEIVAEAGTYVKEFIHGDEGRTKPNLADELGVKCSVEELDVLEIMDEQGVK